MPKTRKKRKGKLKSQKSSAATDESSIGEVSSKLDSEAKNGDTDTLLTDKSESDLKAQLQEEINRLQEEYMRQKQVTEELNRERNKVIENRAINSEHVIPTGELPSPARPEYPEIYAEETPIEHDIIDDSAIYDQFRDTVTEIRNELDQLKINLNDKADSSRLSELTRIEELNSHLQNNVQQFSVQVGKLQKEVKKTDQKLSDVLLDLGFEENLDINKVPHKILVLVYETILNDAIQKIRHTKGVQDTETAVNDILENIRSHTSGAELFKFEHNKISIPELHQYLKKKLISPNQIHITYNSILEKFLEYVPGYTPKNFKAMIKIKSQEYTISNVIKLDERFEDYVAGLAKLEKNLNKFLEEYEENTANQESRKDEIGDFHTTLTALSERIEDIPNLLEKILAAQLEDKINTILDTRLSEISLDKSSEMASSDKKKTGKKGKSKKKSAETVIDSDDEAKDETEGIPEIKPEMDIETGTTPEQDSAIEDSQVPQVVQESPEVQETETDSEPESQPAPEITSEPPSTPTPPPPIFKSITLGDDESDDLDFPKKESETEDSERENEEEIDEETDEDKNKEKAKDIEEDSKLIEKIIKSSRKGKKPKKDTKNTD
jgi:hypothetical protein